MNKEEAVILWTRGSDYYVFKIGNCWKLADCFGNFPAFKTKKEALKAADTFILEYC
jgi:hypothetical protein